jgi:hypothetical protein
MVDWFSVPAVRDADFDLRKLIKVVQLCESDRGVTVNLKFTEILRTVF